MRDRPLPDEPLMTAKEAAAKLNMSVKTLMKHVNEGRLRFINIGTLKRRVFRFTDYNLKTFIENQKTKEVPACLSSKSPKAPSISMNSKSTVIDFVALQKPGTKKTPKLSSVT